MVQLVAFMINCEVDIKSEKEWLCKIMAAQSILVTY